MCALRQIPNAIYHEDLARRLHVEADIEGRDLGSVVAEVEASPGDGRVSLSDIAMRFC